METERKVQVGSLRTGWRHAGLQSCGIQGPLTVLTKWAPVGTGVRRKDVHASLRPQSGPHGLGAGMGRESLYVYIVDVQIANLGVGREHFVKQMQEEVV